MRAVTLLVLVAFCCAAFANGAEETVTKVETKVTEADPKDADPKEATESEAKTEAEEKDETDTEDNDDPANDSDSEDENEVMESDPSSPEEKQEEEGELEAKDTSGKYFITRKLNAYFSDLVCSTILPPLHENLATVLFHLCSFLKRHIYSPEPDSDFENFTQPTDLD
eukprot:gene7633-13450_t